MTTYHPCHLEAASLDAKRKYVIQLPTIGGRFLCYPDSKVAIIYGPKDPKLKFDLQLTKGVVREVNGEVFSTIFESGAYDNRMPSAAKIKAEYLLEIREAMRDEDRRQTMFDFVTHM